MKGFHKIMEDITPFRDTVYWEWVSSRKEFRRLSRLLAAHAELNRRYPEENNESQD